MLLLFNWDLIIMSFINDEKTCYIKEIVVSSCGVDEILLWCHTSNECIKWQHIRRNSVRRTYIFIKIKRIRITCILIHNESSRGCSNKACDCQIWCRPRMDSHGSPICKCLKQRQSIHRWPLAYAWLKGQCL